MLQWHKKCCVEIQGVKSKSHVVCFCKLLLLMFFFDTQEILVKSCFLRVFFSFWMLCVMRGVHCRCWKYPSIHYPNYFYLNQKSNTLKAIQFFYNLVVSNAHLFPWGILKAVVPILQKKKSFFDCIPMLRHAPSYQGFTSTKRLGFTAIKNT